MLPDQLELLNVIFWILLFCIRVGLNPYTERPRTRCAEINSKLIDITLSTSGWSGSEPPYTYTISNSSITDTNEAVEIAPNNSATNEQLLAYMACGLCGGTISVGKIVLKAFGKKPSTNIPIVMIIRGEI